MKKIFTIVIFALLTLGATAKSGSVSKNQIISTINEFSQCDGFDVVKVGSLGTSIIKGFLRSAIEEDADPEDREVLKIVSGIKRIAIVSYDEAREKEQRLFNERIERALSGAEVLMDVKDDGDVMRMYGVVDENATKIKDFVLYSPTDATLICLFGSIPLSALKELAD